MTVTRLRCVTCGSRFDQPHTRGPVPKYCSGACRQAAHRLRHSVVQGKTASSQTAVDAALEEVLQVGASLALDGRHDEANRLSAAAKKIRQAVCHHPKTTVIRKADGSEVHCNRCGKNVRTDTWIM